LTGIGPATKVKKGPALNASPGSPTLFRRSLLVTPLTVGLLVLLVLGSGCAPASPDHAAWTDQAKQSLADAVSEVSTVTLAIQLQQRGDLAQNYQQVVALDSEETLGLTAQKLGGMQPPAEDDQEYARVTTALSDASDLLADVRIAVVREDTGEYSKLLQRLARTRADLLSLKDRL
jgi:hypothetical protein